MKLARAHRLRVAVMDEMMAICRLGALAIPPAWPMAALEAAEHTISAGT